MASAFATGFAAGQRGYQQVLDNNRQKELDERAAKEFARKEQEWSRADAERADVDRAISEYRDLSSSGQAVAENTSGFSAPSARMLYAQGGQQAVDDAASYANAESARFGLPLANRTSLPAAPDAATTPTVKMRQATPLDRIKGLEGIALAKKDVASMERLGGQRQVAEEDMFIADAMKSYKGTEDQIGSTASYINNNSKRVTIESPNNSGFVRLSVVGTDGRAEFMKLSKQDQAKLYAAGQLLERNPTRALEIMSSVNKELASAIAQENGLVDKLATNANDVAYKGGQLGVAQQNANTNEAYRRDMVALQRDRVNAISAGKQASAGRPVKMDVETLDPVTGKKTKVQVLMNPSTGEAVTADGRPFKDSAALDRAMGVMNQESQLGAAEANDLRLIEEQFKSGSIAPTKGQTPMQALDAARNEVRQIYAARRGALAFAQLDEDEKVNTLRKMANASGKDAEQIASLVGADPKYVKKVLDSGNKIGGLPPPKAGIPSKADPLQSAYEDWQNAKGSWLTNWFRQRGPGAAEAEREAEARYTEMLRNQYGK